MPPTGRIMLNRVESSDRPKSGRKSVATDWSAYATAYDLMSEQNPAYQDLLLEFEAFLGTLEKPKLIYDIGGGTGNFTRIAARACPSSEIIFLEPDTGMLDLARAKLTSHMNIDFDARGLEDLETDRTAELVICIHALYTMPSPARRLADLRRLLRPGGLLYLVDLGRFINLTDWRRYLFRSLRKKKGVFGALRVFWQGREIAKQNSNILKAQKDGLYWTHTGAQIASAANEAGFEILRQESVYRGYSDLLVCRAAP